MSVSVLLIIVFLPFFHFPHLSVPPSSLTILAYFYYFPSPEASSGLMVTEESRQVNEPGQAAPPGAQKELFSSHGKAQCSRISQSHARSPSTTPK